MKLTVFLGNPGLKYRKTRHNVGFMVGNFYVRKSGAKWKHDKKFAAEIARDGDTLFAKPQLFYNLTGESVTKIMKFYKVRLGDLLVVCDDLNLAFGQIRYRDKGSDGGNNGLKSIIALLGSSDFARLRVGTKNELKAKMNDADFVLSKLSREEQSQMTVICENASSKIDEFLN